ncbi:ABC-type uncharacterized transport system [Sphingopyxis sp. YR583]|uniref:Gldg family protein n=1 Tax=Sphingopyxis sp. YR583 TaxID=1881047 RepID=UPI0008A80CD3|nr:hypothetical protein [Sphingopyxis sp. YR583]SEH11904.1 ABC-type uncharacterized transport system [Sphingopyxis sp. YR583]
MAASRGSLLRALAAAVAIAALAWVAGGQALLGRIDPALAVPLLAPPILLLAWFERDKPARARLQALFLFLLLLAAGQALLGLSLAGSVGLRQLLVVMLSGGVASLVADALVRWRPRFRLMLWATALLFAIGWFGAGHMLLAALYRPTLAPTNAPAATMITGLPLRWAGGGDIAAMIVEGANDDPALARLTATGPISLVDSIVDHAPPPRGALLLAHPRALAPQELVAIDGFVRGGGRAVIFADALSGWPARHPLGDPRNPPVTSLLTPLLDHWGVTLDAAPAQAGEALPVDVDGARLRLFSVGRLERLPATCRAYADRHAARCRIGQGEVWLVGDADLLFAPLWRPLVPGADHLRQADTMEWLSARLWPGAGRAALHPLWIRIRPN